MTEPEPSPVVIDALRRAVERAPDDLELRRHLAQLLLAAGQDAEAVTELSHLLARDPSDEPARELMRTALAGTQGDPEPDRVPAEGPPTEQGFDWAAAEEQIRAGDPTLPRLSDVAGLASVKEHLEASFLAPLRNPELRALYGTRLRGGLLMYGPPGCGKTFLARALAGELGAGFLSVGLDEILDMWVGSSERNLHELFVQARRTAPCVVFLDEIDALGQKRSQLRNSAVRGVSAQLLTELDGVSRGDDGVYVLAATNQPWDVDPALRRPGRLDRTVLVLPPDRAAREALFRQYLDGRPTEDVDVAELAAGSEGLTGADIGYVCELAAERVLLEASRGRRAPRLTGADLRGALADVPPSAAPWMQMARTVARYGEDDGTFKELTAYLKRTKQW